MQQESSVPVACKMEKHHPYENEESPSKIFTSTADDAIYDKKADLRQLTL